MYLKKGTIIMDLKVTQENLSKALIIVARVATGRSTLPILSNILFAIEDNRLRLSATNLDIAISKYVGAKVTKSGTVTIPARLVQDFISSLPESTIAIKQEDQKLHIDAGNYTSTINGIAADEFPVMPVIKDGESWTIPAETFKRALQQVSIAASHDETRPILTGVYIHTIKNQLFIAATDSYRLAEKKLPVKKQTKPLLIPVSAIQELLRILQDESGDVTITHDSQQVRFNTLDTELVARLIDGTYPEYQKLIPSAFEHTATLKKNELINITKVSSLFARESAGSITIRFSKKDQQVHIHSVASQVGENSSSAAATVSSDADITLNSRYLLEGLQALDGEEVTIAFNGKLEPVVLTSPTDESYLHIVMPLKS